MNTMLLKNTQNEISVVFSAGYADGAVTVTITKADGTVLVTATATRDNTVAGRYTYGLAPQPDVIAATVRWAGAWGGVAQSLDFPLEVVGAHLFTIAEARAFGDKALQSSSTYPDAAIIDARERITDWFQAICSVAFVPRYGRVVLDGSGTCSLWLPHSAVTRVFSVTENGVALNLSDVYVYSVGRLERRTSWFREYQNIVAAYEHGFSAPPDDITRAALMVARYDLTSNQLADRFISFQNDLGVIRQAVPGAKYPTGIPIVDAVLARYSRSMPLQPLTKAVY